MSSLPFISVVVPVYNEEAVLEMFYNRLAPVLHHLNTSFEIIFINDGSTDHSLSLLRRIQKNHPYIKVIDFIYNFGQHMAIMAGFEYAKGQMIITLDADLQNPPENIPALIAAFEKGHDVINTYRQRRKDTLWRRLVSYCHNKIRQWFIPYLVMKDEGSMLRGYSKRVVDLMVKTAEKTTFIPALALLYSQNPCEIAISHEFRAAGTSHYTFNKLLRCNFDLMTGFSLVPLQAITLGGLGFIGGSFLFFIFLIIKQCIGAQVSTNIILFAIVFLLLGIIVMALGIIGEYIGRIYQEVRKRPRFIIKEIIE